MGFENAVRTFYGQEGGDQFEILCGRLLWTAPNAAFTHAGLTTRYRTESLYKSIFVL